ASDAAVSGRAASVRSGSDIGLLGRRDYIPPSSAAPQRVRIQSPRIARFGYGLYNPANRAVPDAPPMLIECVPNVSEGRRPEIIDAMARALAAAPGVRLLDHSSDPAHNRSVFTLAGDAAGLEAAVLALFERAVAEIDLRRHQGEHPRLGAGDVVPFVPIEGATMADCVALARKTGAAIAERCPVPVFLYERAPAT